jgi:hypothetical protein
MNTSCLRWPSTVILHHLLQQGVWEACPYRKGCCRWVVWSLFLIPVHTATTLNLISAAHFNTHRNAQPRTDDMHSWLHFMQAYSTERWVFVYRNLCSCAYLVSDLCKVYKERPSVKKCDCLPFFPDLWKLSSFQASGFLLCWSGNLHSV